MLLVILQSRCAHDLVQIERVQRPKDGPIEVGHYEERCVCRIGGELVARLGRDDGHIERAGRRNGGRIAGDRADQTNAQWHRAVQLLLSGGWAAAAARCCGRCDRCGAVGQRGGDCGVGGKWLTCCWNFEMDKRKIKRVSRTHASAVR